MEAGRAPVSQLLLLLLLLWLTAAGPRAAATAGGTARMFGGSQAAEGDFPSVVSIRVYFRVPGTEKRSTCSCGGSVLSERWVLTAGHCLIRVPGMLPTNSSVYAGSTKRIHPGVVTSGTFFTHPNYYDNVAKERVTSDLGLMLLDQPLPLSRRILPALLPGPGQFFPTNSWATFVGFGAHEEGHSSSLKELVLQGFRYDGDLLIARGDGVGPCFGDSGGPMFIGNFTAGVASSVVDDSGGTSCVLPGDKYFINVALYRDWIRNVTSV